MKKVKWRLRLLQILATLTGIPLFGSMSLSVGGNWQLGLVVGLLTIALMGVLSMLIIKERGW